MQLEQGSAIFSGAKGSAIPSGGEKSVQSGEALHLVAVSRCLTIGRTPNARWPRHFPSSFLIHAAEKPRRATKEEVGAQWRSNSGADKNVWTLEITDQAIWSKSLSQKAIARGMVA